MQRARVGIVGCGPMGRRHVAGYAELAATPFANVEVAAVCDLNDRAVEQMAEECRVLLGSRPRVFQSIATMAEAVDSLAGVDIVTDPRSHHRIAIECLDRGLHVQVEKPLAITIRACNLLIRASRRSRGRLSVAENFRRDPMNRLIRAMIDDGAIGDPAMVLETSARGGDRVLGSEWRHDALSGGLLLDLGIHTASLLRYFGGDIESVMGATRLVRRRRRRVGRGAREGEWIGATAHDLLTAVLQFRHGIVGQWCLNAAAAGQMVRQRVLYGSRGSIVAPVDASGRSPRLDLIEGRSLTDDALLEYAPSYRLDALGAHLFGVERPTSYRLSTPEIDRKLLAMELHGFGDVILKGSLPEVDALGGRRDVALVCAVLESARLQRAISLDQVESGDHDLAQREMDGDLGLIEVPGAD
ncbi:MAG: Gfo/Idh/MocA family oxidoreductase [Chloroflexi bacterium]|nr:Gfo/Idh/MocA family oxidoreductase [Chloroflexota bacterium]